jgi:hypothetical protein
MNNTATFFTGGIATDRRSLNPREKTSMKKADGSASGLTVGKTPRFARRMLVRAGTFSSHHEFITLNLTLLSPERTSIIDSGSPVEDYRAHSGLELGNANMLMALVEVIHCGG